LIAAEHVSFVRLDLAYGIPYAFVMKSIPATKARQNLYRLVDEVAETSEPVAITGRRGSAVLVSEADWRAIDETLYLLSIPGLRESIRAGMRQSLAKSVKKPGW